MSKPTKPGHGKKPKSESEDGKAGSDIRVKRGINGAENAPEMQRRGMKDGQEVGKEETGSTESGEENKGAKR